MMTIKFGLTGRLAQFAIAACGRLIGKTGTGKPLLAIALSGVFLLPASALNAAKAEEQAAAAPSFWKVEGKHNTVWLFGSIHVLTEAHYPLADAVEQAFERAPNFVVEVDILNMDQARFQQTLMAEGRLGQDESLRSMLGEERYARASEMAAAAGYDLSAMQGLHPWLVMLMVSMNEYMRMGYTPDQGVETYFLRRANQQEKSIIELETVQTQLRVFTEMGEKAEVAALMHTLENLSDMQTQIRQMVSAWEKGNLTQLEGQLLEEFADFPGAYRSLITDRNRNWVGQLKQILQHGKEDHFVAVGALHMVGEQGVVNLLREQGYEVQPQ